MTLALGLGLAPRASFLALNRGLGQEAEALAPGAAQERGPLKALDEGRSRGSGRLAKVLGEEHLVKRFNDLNGKRVQPWSSGQGPLGCLVRVPLGLGRLPWGLGVVSWVGNMLT